MDNTTKSRTEFHPTNTVQKPAIRPFRPRCEHGYASSTSPDRIDPNESLLPQAHTWGLQFTQAASCEDVAAELLAGKRGRPTALPLLVTPNVDILVTLRDDLRLRKIVNQAAYVLADGQPLVTFSKFAGDELPARIAGSDLTAAMWPTIIEESRSVYAITSTAGVAERLSELTPTCVAQVAPMFNADELDAEIDLFAMQVIGEIIEMDSKPEFVFIGIGFPKDARLADAILRQWPRSAGIAPVFLAIGASLEFLTGTKSRAPQIMQRMGIEFLHRIASEPRRMLKRYFVRDAVFFMILAQHSLASFRSRR